MDEKELMIPLELGYVEEAERKKKTPTSFTLFRTVLKCLSLICLYYLNYLWSLKCYSCYFSRTCGVFSFLET